MAGPLIAKELQASFRLALAEAKRMHHEYLTLEHLLLALLKDAKTRQVLTGCGANIRRLQKRLEEFLEQTVERLPAGVEADPQQTISVERVLQRAAIHALSAEQKIIDGGDVLVAIFREEESHALYLLQQEGVSRLDVLNYVSHGLPKEGFGSEGQQEDEEGASPTGDP
ncbi:MAG TPA: Clp protease N-terminal domain-containing protein, partial [Myxococcaceae bacterium]|nr:Clp protease N-terminal domain-containing protein [Myxococcaceae bacterium]